MRIDTRRVVPSAPSEVEGQWIEEVLRNSPDATVFHTREWNQILMREFGARNITLLAMMGNEPVGLYSFYVNSDHQCRCPQIDLETPFGGPIATRDANGVVSSLLKEGERLQSSAIFQIWTPPNYTVGPLVKNGYRCTQMWTSILNLQRSEEELWASFERNKRRTITKAVRNEVHLVEGDVALVDEYYKIAASTLLRAGKEPLPRTFYRRVVEEMGRKGMAKIVLAEYDGRFIAGVIDLPYKDTVYGWHMGSFKEYWRLGANDFLQWELIKWARQRGYKRYDFLRVEPERLPGIARWKMDFGGDTVPCYFLDKPTPGYQLWRVMRFATSPRRIADKLRRWVPAVKNGQ